MSDLRTSSTRRGKRLFWALLGLLTPAVAALSICAGSVTLSFHDIFSALLGRDTTSAAARIEIGRAHV